VGTIAGGLEVEMPLDGVAGSLSGAHTYRLDAYKALVGRAGSAEKTGLNSNFNSEIDLARPVAALNFLLLAAVADTQAANQAGDTMGTHMGWAFRANTDCRNCNLSNQTA